jgi:hypothetical protein
MHAESYAEVTDDAVAVSHAGKIYGQLRALTNGFS